MSELGLLRGLLLASMAIAPFATRRFFVGSRAHVVAHAGAFACAAIGLLAPVPILCVAWLAFCAASFALVVRSRWRALRSPHGLAACVPFAFSNIAAVWLVGGANDLGVLGYGEHFSYYAALHGNVIGWIVLGAISALADRATPQRRLYVASVFVCLVAFLLIAFGIDRLRALKPIGVIVLSLAIPIAQLAFLRRAWSRHRGAFAIGCISLAGLGYTMVLAWRNELALAVAAPGGIRGMVAIHGVLNTLVVGPAFLLAVWLAGASADDDQPGLVTSQM